MMRSEKADNNARLNLIVTEPIHRAVGVAAAADDRSVNSWCRQVLKAALRKKGFDVGKEAAAKIRSDAASERDRILAKANDEAAQLADTVASHLAAATNVIKRKPGR
jgi:plasmid stability protein